MEKFTEVSMEEACRLTKQNVKPLTETEDIDIERAVGRVLAKDVIAEFSQPPFDKSPLDGFAVRSEDIASASLETPVQLRVTGEVFAGSVSDTAVNSGQAVRIMTGAPIPQGADCVVKQEDTETVIRTPGEAEEYVILRRPMAHHQNYCFSGEDFQIGQRILPKNRKLDFMDIGLLASLGKTQVEVFRKFRVAVVATGDEIISPGLPLTPGKIYNSNMFMIRAGVQSCGGEVSFCTHAPDSFEKISDCIRTAAESADLVITTGGVSVGQKDYLPGVLRSLGAEILFQRIRIKPGSPTTFSIFNNTPILSLTGSPFGAAVNFNLLAKPMIGAASRDSSLDLHYEYASFQGVFQKSSPKTRYVRGILGADKSVSLMPDTQNSASDVRAVGQEPQQEKRRILNTLREGQNCYIEIPAGTEFLKGGEILRVICI